MRHRNIILAIIVLLSVMCSWPTSNVAAERGDDKDQRAVRVMIITTFNETPDPSIPGEATLWQTRDKLDKQIKVKGLSKSYPTVNCNNDGECLVITDSRFTNATASMMALILSDKFDLR